MKNYKFFVYKSKVIQPYVILVLFKKSFPVSAVYEFYQRKFLIFVMPFLCPLRMQTGSD